MNGSMVHLNLILILIVMSVVIIMLFLPLGPCGLFTAVISTVMLFEVIAGYSPVTIELGYWLQGLNVEWSFLFDS